MINLQDGFPLITLHPVADAGHGWVGLSLATERPLTGDDLIALFGQLGLGEALGGLSCVLDLPDPSVCSAAVIEALPAKQLVLSLPGPVVANAGNQEQLAGLRAAGIRLLVDGVTAEGIVSAGGVDGFTAHCAAIGAGSAVAMRPGLRLARSVATLADLARCQAAGYSWFVGNYPLHAESRAFHGTTHQSLLMRLLALVAADADSHEIEALFKQDVHLSYQLLKLVNSVAFSLSSKINSFSQAITLLGRRQLQRWLQLLLYARSPGADANPLMPRAAWRAELMEVLCARQGGDHELQDRAFMVGMFSLLTVLLGMAIDDIVAPLNLPDDVVIALTGHEGPLGRLLRVVELAEDGVDSALAVALAGAGLDPVTWAEATIQAYHWAIRVSREA